MEMNLDFSEKKVQAISLDALRMTITEKYPNGNPVGGIYHYQLIDQLLSWLKDVGYEAEVTDLFAANNRDKYRPGVTFDPVAADKFGDKDPRAYMLRRVYCNLLLRSHDDEGLTSCCAVSYSQRGISVAFGAHVRYCRNLSLLSAERVFSNYGMAVRMREENLQLNTEKCLDQVCAYIMTEKDIHGGIIGQTRGMSQEQFTDRDFQELLEMLMRARICHDSSDKVIHVSDEYALNSSQINAACARYYVARKGMTEGMTFWQALQLFNQDLKPDLTDQPMIIPQSAQLGSMFMNLLERK